jgi:hypothetical protein
VRQRIGIESFSKTSTHRPHLLREAEFAFLQAFAPPTLPETANRYGNLLLAEKRIGDATLLVETALNLAPTEKKLLRLRKFIKQAATQL